MPPVFAKPELIWRFTTFIIKQREKALKLEEYVRAPQEKKTSTMLHLETVDRLGKYPDESYHFYVPESQAEAENYMYQEKSFIAYCNTLKWLLERDERKELLFLLYRGAHSLSLWYNMSSQGYRSTLVQMMELPPPSSILDRTEMPSAMECPIDVRGG